jgi:hypothetical protein
MACVGTFVEAVGHGGIRYCTLNRYAVGKLPGGSGCKGDNGLSLVVDHETSCPAIVQKDLDLPKAIFGVAPPSQDGLVVECDFATCFVEKYFASRVAQDGNREEIVDEAGESMC